MADNSDYIYQSITDDIRSATIEDPINPEKVATIMEDTVTLILDCTANSGGPGGTAPFDITNCNNIIPSSGFGTGNSISSCGQHSLIGGGSSNQITLSNSIIGGGTGNQIRKGQCSNSCDFSSSSSIGAGISNKIVGGNNFIGAGYTNCISMVGNDNISLCYSFIGAGSYNVVAAPYSAVISGNQNTVQGSYTTVNGGMNICLNGNFSSGAGNSISSNYDSTHVFGNGICTNRQCATFVNQLSIMDIGLDTGSCPTGSLYRDCTGAVFVKMAS